MTRDKTQVEHSPNITTLNLQDVMENEVNHPQTQTENETAPEIARNAGIIVHLETQYTKFI